MGVQMDQGVAHQSGRGVDAAGQDEERVLGDLLQGQQFAVDLEVRQEGQKVLLRVLAALGRALEELHAQLLDVAIELGAFSCARRDVAVAVEQVAHPFGVRSREAQEVHGQQGGDR